MGYPGFGPWSYLPPWERPGWRYGYGRGWCWRTFPLVRPYGVHELTVEDEIDMLEEEAKYLEETLSEIKKRLEKLKKP